MTKENNHIYSLSSRFISLIFLIFLGIVIYITWKIESVREKTTEDRLSSIAYIINKKTSNHLSKNSTTEIPLKEINQIVLDNIDSPNESIYYAILDSSNHNVILHSPDFDINIHQEIMTDYYNFTSNNKSYSSHITKDKSYIISKLSDSSFVFIIGTSPLIKNYEDYFYIMLPYKFEILCLLLTIVSLIYLFYRSILDPFLALSQAALRISNGDIHTAIPTINNKEGVLVADALEKIKSSLKVEKQLVQEISQTRNILSLTNLKLENKVAKRTTELKKALAEKTLFINNLSHEIKTPLQSVSRILESLVSNWPELNEEEKFTFSNQAAHSSQHLLSLVDNLLEIAKLSDGKVILNIKNSDLLTLIKEVAEECKMLYMHNKKLRIIISNNKSIYANIDKIRIKQVIRNLLLNAIKFSSNNGSISINISLTKIFAAEGLRLDAVQFSIHDQGIGIPEDEIYNIFSPFAQGNNTNNKSIGTGLGLTICHEIINAHYGKIWAENNKDGGASFNFVIPITQPIELTDSLPASINLKNTEYNILMVDDEEVCLNSMEMLLYDSQYNLIKVKSAQLALEYLKEHAESISTILIDLMMPDIYGINLLSAIKADSKLALIPVILQTSSSDENEILKAFEKGIFSFIRKPYNKKKLLDEIKRAVQFKELNKQDQKNNL